ncbi:putative histidine kinase hhk13p protein [Phaeoacremonium minimum UCRPA7]|uniref:Putative histidine kinase hhk13p protein n=1 Tax=Phaeoacremonium minimum (strain UCR-PA7) TaxID=1286976 RepID=R8BGZ8_PHAM7|nr:putative histidine kinase hhk13p protein [Phaeoacremonium minimum UCRPA7]EON98559.1 putative histidine kinase hhk13p protein [Phaeoacremonium minimum UCRPA7]
MASVVLFEEEIKRGQRAAKLAALDRQELSMQLRLRTQEAVESEYKFTRMAEFVPVGMFIANHEGLINFCNDSWWELSRHPRSADSVDAWMQSIRDEDRPGVEAAWTKLITERIAVTHEFRFKCSREADGHAIDTWVLMSAYPERDADGGLKSIFGCLTDISQQKWAEVFQKQRREEAVELKRQQENFIDITSHEMRNPLSAILQCADEIINGVTNYRTEDPSSYVPGNLNVLLDSALEAANTISLCASHQKRIVDDILTLSKLDSQLLYVTPVDVQPVAVIETVLKMFESELNSNSIRGEFRIDPSFQELNINWAKLDPSRLRQVLINLMTNAIKFTQSRENRSIVITLGASRRISEASPEWGQGEKINLHVAVTDTGPGLDENERVILFQRFSQASPRTHVQYGGSGLGLFISRILTELQGGQIGVQSEKGVGSTFAFYIKSRKVELPQLSPTTIVPPPVSPYKITATQTLQYTTSRSGSDAASPQLSQRKNSQNVSPISARDPHAPPPLDVLIVEDNIVNQTVLQRQLRKSGNNTPGSSKASASDSGSGESESEKNTENINISVILMDLEMPVMDGMTCARKIRQLERAGTINRHIPIIAVTAYARPEQIENAKAAGVDDVISKPFRIPELIPKIEELVAKYQTHTISP